MTFFLHIKTVFFAALLLSCNGQFRDAKNSSKTISIADTPECFVKNYGVNDNNHLFAFVGEKLSVEEIPYKRGAMNNGFKAKYVILKKIYGDFSEDTIEFIAYDHYGTPFFSEFKNVLLYVSADSGTYYHETYMYNDVYKTGDGRWAGLYASSDYKHVYNKRTKIKPVQIDFTPKVILPLKKNDADGRPLVFWYPDPYFKTVGDSAVAIYGNYVEELFALKKTGVLTARGLFEATAEQEEDMVESNQPEPSRIPPSVNDLKFLAFWNTFVASVKDPGLSHFKNIALDSLLVCGKLLSTGDFINKCFDEAIDDEVQKRIIDKTKLEYTSSEVEFKSILTSNARREIVKVGNKYRFRQMSVTRSTKNNNPPTIYFDFIETKKGYRLYRIDHSWFKECCK